MSYTGQISFVNPGPGSYSCIRWRQVPSSVPVISSPGWHFQCTHAVYQQSRTLTEADLHYMLTCSYIVLQHPLLSSHLIPLIPRAVCHSLVLSQCFGMLVQAIFQKDADPGMLMDDCDWGPLGRYYVNRLFSHIKQIHPALEKRQMGWCTVWRVDLFRNIFHKSNPTVILTVLFWESILFFSRNSHCQKYQCNQNCKAAYQCKDHNASLLGLKEIKIKKILMVWAHSSQWPETLKLLHKI